MRVFNAMASLMAAMLLMIVLPVGGQSIEQKLQRLDGKLNKNRAIKLTGQDFAYVTGQPRNYSIFVSLTALAPEMGCAPCRDFESEFNLVASSWQRQGIQQRLYFGQLDFADGKEVFQKLKIQSVPLVLHFPPTEGPNAVVIGGEFEQYDLNRWGLTADALAKYVSSSCKLEFQLRRPIDYSRYIATGILILGALTAAKLLWKHLVAVFQSRKIWSMGLIGWSVLMCSGHMWNTIRGPPYTGMRDNRPEIVAPGFQNQFILETQIVGLLYAAISITFVLIVTKIPKLSDPLQQRTATYALVIIFMVLYSIMLKFFKMKNGSYPYKLLF
ncbi:hypothetical protein DFJ77DRAFT_121511 [Powellomyces hirtus]|nr:hypothetical protein DFJ77DRAFT_121511 [Powellomyces hirtus]